MFAYLGFYQILLIIYEIVKKKDFKIKNFCLEKKLSKVAKL
jgi:hypothetical protein